MFQNDLNVSYGSLKVMEIKEFERNPSLMVQQCIYEEQNYFYHNLGTTWTAAIQLWLRVHR